MAQGGARGENDLQAVAPASEIELAVHPVNKEAALQKTEAFKDRHRHKEPGLDGFATQLDAVQDRAAADGETTDGPGSDHPDRNTGAPGGRGSREQRLHITVVEQGVLIHGQDKVRLWPGRQGSRDAGVEGRGNPRIIPQAHHLATHGSQLVQDPGGVQRTAVVDDDDLINLGQQRGGVG